MELTNDNREKRRVYNQRYYNRNRRNEVVAEKARVYYELNKQVKRDRQTFYYYRKTNNMEGLKKKYPTIYNIYVNNIT